jgi:hypothetical protein
MSFIPRSLATRECYAAPPRRKVSAVKFRLHFAVITGVVAKSINCLGPILPRAKNTRAGPARPDPALANASPLSFSTLFVVRFSTINVATSIDFGVLVAAIGLLWVVCSHRGVAPHACLSAETKLPVAPTRCKSRAGCLPGHRIGWESSPGPCGSSRWRDAY